MCLGSTPKPEVPAAPPVSRDVSPEMSAARNRSRQQQLAAAGMAGTTRTGPAGLAMPAPINVKTLLGQ